MDDVFRERSIVHVIACARALVYGSRTMRDVCQDALEYAVRILDTCECVAIDNDANAAKATRHEAAVIKPPSAEHVCIEHCSMIGAGSYTTAWCRVCGAYNLPSNTTNEWVKPQQAQP